jgi:putative transcriptional regulator
MGKLSEKALAAWERTRDLNAEMVEDLGKIKRGGYARKTEFFPRRDGSIRRVISRADGTVEKDHIIPAERALVAKARAATGLSQTAFASLLGVSVRTLQEWEQGRKIPSGAAATLLKVAAKYPNVLKGLAA